MHIFTPLVVLLGMTVGPNTEDDGVVKVKYGGRKRNKNKDMREDGMELSVNGDDGSVDVKVGVVVVVVVVVFYCLFVVRRGLLWNRNQ